MFQECPVGCAECSESSDEIICDKCLSLTHVEVDGIKSECVGECQCVTLYRIVPNRYAGREGEGLGAHLLISQKWNECGHLLYLFLTRVDN